MKVTDNRPPQVSNHTHNIRNLDNHTQARAPPIFDAARLSSVHVSLSLYILARAHTYETYSVAAYSAYPDARACTTIYTRLVRRVIIFDSARDR